MSNPQRIQVCVINPNVVLLGTGELGPERTTIIAAWLEGRKKIEPALADVSFVVLPWPLEMLTARKGGDKLKALVEQLVTEEIARREKEAQTNA